MRRFLIGALGLAAALAFLWYIGGEEAPQYVQRGVPAEPPETGAQPQPALSDRGPRMTEEAVIFLARKDLRPLACSRVLETAGVPFSITDSSQAALARRFIVIPADDRPLRLDGGLLEGLKRFVEAGGTLVLQAPVDRLAALTGAAKLSPGRSRRRLRFESPYVSAFLDESEEKEVLLASARTREGIWTQGIKSRGGAGEPVAVFPDSGETAMLRRRMGSGAVYTLGLDLKDVVLRPQAGRHFRADREPSTGFEPGADVWPLVFRSLYEDAVPFRVRLRSLPGASKAVLILTHNIGWGASLDGVRAFAEVERARGVRSTWFVQTRYAPGGLDASLWDDRMRKALAGLRAAGHEIAAHTVSHGPDLAALPFGTGEEVMESYLPRLGKDGRTRGGTLMGEVRVPGLLLGPIVGLRSAFKAFPDSLDSAAAQAGLEYDSSLSAAQTLGYFPFRLLRGRGMDEESGVVELPMGAEDENEPDDPTEPEAVLALLRKTSANDCPMVWLLHPSAAPHKRSALAKVLDSLPAGTSVLTAGEAARFWNARAETRFSFVRHDAKALLTIWPPPGRHSLSFEVSQPVRSCSSAARVSCAGSIVVLEDSPGGRVDVNLALK